MKAKLGLAKLVLSSNSLRLMTGSKMLEVQSFHHKSTCAYSHLIHDSATREAAVIDPVMDYDPITGRISYEFIDRIIAVIVQNQLSLKWSLETHVHADHFTASQYLKEKLGAKLVISKNVQIVQEHFDGLYDLNSHHEPIFDVLVNDADTLKLGELDITVLNTPGHTPACVSYLIKDAEACVVFVGDTLFMPDKGTARCDFPGGDASTLFDSLQMLLSLDDETRLYLCHDNPSQDRAASSFVTVKEQNDKNIHCAGGISQQEYVALREGRDVQLALPKLYLSCVQMNIRGGKLPEKSANGCRYLKTPLTI